MFKHRNLQDPKIEIHSGPLSGIDMFKLVFWEFLVFFSPREEFLVFFERVCLFLFQGGGFYEGSISKISSEIEIFNRD